MRHLAPGCAFSQDGRHHLRLQVLGAAGATVQLEFVRVQGLSEVFMESQGVP